MKKLLICLCVAAILPACVTINIYFPAAAADKAADKIIDDVWQLKDSKEKTTTPKDATQPTAPAQEPAPAPEAKQREIE